jgi:flagellar M-ring protein FliF
MDKAFTQIAAFLKSLSLRQRIILGGSIVLVAGTLWIFVRLLGDGDYKTLYSGLNPADAQSLTQRLGTQNIAFQISPDGTAVLVPADQLDKARLEVAAQGPLASGRLGFELFDKPNWSGSDFSEKVNYQRALEAELERTIQTMNGVTAVRVHLVLPHESLFTERMRPAKAAVVLKMRGTRLSEALATSVANLVSSAWDDLTPQNVTVVTTDGQGVQSSHGRAPEVNGLDLETALAEKVAQTLAPVVGPEHVKSSVTIEYDPTSGESTQELYDPNITAVLTSQISQESVNDIEPGGIPGTPSNTPNPAAPGTVAGQARTTATTQGIRSESKTFAVSRTTRHLLEPAGRIKHVAAAVLVDDVIEQKTEGGRKQETRRKRTPEEMKQIEAVARAALGFDATRGDQLSVQNVSFQIPPVEVPAGPTPAQRIQVYAERWISLLRYAALFALFALVYLLMLRPVKKQVLAMLRLPAVAGGAPALAAGAANAAAAMAGAKAVANLEAEILNADVTPEVSRAIALKKQLVTKVKEDPESASRLIQNWLRETEVRK